MTPIETLKKAKANIEDPSKWTQHDLINEEGCMCSIGAVIKVMQPNAKAFTIDPIVMDEALAFSTKYLKVPHYPEEDIASHNDHPQTTHQDIMNMFDHSINRLEKQNKPSIIPRIKRFCKNV